MAAKKKPASAADFRKKEEADKKKMTPATPTATYKGQKVNWQTPKPVAGNTVGPKKYPEIKSGGKVEDVHNALRSIIVGGPARTVITQVTKPLVNKTTKNLQRQLSNFEKDKNMKGLSRNERIIEGERRSELTPEEYMENYGSGVKRDLQRSISNSMKNDNNIVRGMNAAGKTVLQGDLAASILAGKILVGKKKPKK